MLAGQAKGEFLELCSCFVKCAILLSFKRRKQDFLPQSPTEPFIFFQCFVIPPSSHTRLTPGCLLSHWDLPLADEKREMQWHGGRLFQTLLWILRLARQANLPAPPLLSLWLTMICTSSPSQAPDWNCLSPPVLPCCCAPSWLYHCGSSRSVPFSVLTEVLSTLNYSPGSSRQNHRAGTMCHMRISLERVGSVTLCSRIKTAYSLSQLFSQAL